MNVLLHLSINFLLCLLNLHISVVFFDVLVPFFGTPPRLLKSILDIKDKRNTNKPLPINHSYQLEERK